MNTVNNTACRARVRHAGAAAPAVGLSILFALILSVLDAGALSGFAHAAAGPPAGNPIDPSPGASIKRTAPGAVARSRILESYGKLPLSFEPNQGQTAPEVKFLSRGHGYALFLTRDEAVLTLKQGRQASVVTGPSSLAKHKGSGTKDAVLTMKLLGANRAALVSGLDELPGKSNYLIGRDPAKWQTDVANYAKVRYAGVYSGVDLVYYGNQRQLEYDFVVAPGADPRAIKLSFGGARHVRIDPATGDLVLTAGSGEVRFRKPVVYHEPQQRGL